MGAPTDFPTPAAAPAARSKKHDEDDEGEHHPVSIASLRSKFETMAHGVHSVAHNAHHSLRPVRPASPVVAASNGAPAVTPTQSQTPSPTSSSPVIQSGATVTSPLPVSSKTVSPVSQSPKSGPLPIPGAGARPPRVPSPGISAPSLAAGRSSPFTSSPLAMSPAASPGASPPKPRPPVVTAAEKTTTPAVNIVLPTPISAEPEEIGDEPAPSVKALRERFGAVTINPKPASRSPSSSRRASFDAPRIAVREATQSERPGEASNSPSGASKRPPLPPPSSKPTVTPPAATVVAPIVGPVGPKHEQSTAVRAKGPAPAPPISRSASPATALLADMTTALTASPLATPSISRSPSPVPATSTHRPPPPPPLVAKTAASAPAAEPIPAPLQKPPVPVRKQTVADVALPPRPSATTSASVPTLPPRRLSTSLPAEVAPTPVPAARAVPPPPARKAEDASSAEASMGPPPPIPSGRPLNAPAAPSSQPSDANPPPPRPAAASVAVPPTPPRPKSAAPSEAAASPPKVIKPAIPANKPPAPTLVPLAVVPPIDAPKPPLPQRKTTLPPPGAPPPRLPARQASMASSIASSTSTRRQGSMTDDSGPFNPPRPPTRSATTLSAVGPPPRRNGTITSNRSTLSSRHHPDSSTSSIRRSGSGDFSDDEDEGGPGQPINSMAQRLLDEHADSSEANRRPPTYSPDIRMTLASAITAFAIHGKYTCIAHHQVRIFDTTFDEQPIHTIELKDTGLEFRVKDPRVTAMCFRPGETAEQEGRYVWCGTKDGHLWELDVMTGEVTTQRPSVHSGAVTQILRSHQFILTIDEIGKVHVFEVEQGAAKRDPVKLVRTIRLSDKATFAKMIRGKLWTATAPAARSATTSSGARGPAVRVYDPCASGTSPPGARMALTSEWTGAATSATVMPMDPDKVFLGHEGGYVSIWTLGEELECQQVLKVSSTDILSLEGVGERLWAGNRKGQIHVYDIEPKPWIVTNVWTAHPDQPVHTLVADPWGIATTGRFMLWSCSRDVLHAWDGLLAVDWTGNRMTERQAEYCDFREVRALVCSWNIDSAKPTDLSGPPQNAHFLDEVLHSVESPDIIVFGFQETIPLTDKKLTAKTFLFGSKGKDTGGATKEGVSGAYRAWADKLQSAVGQISTPDSPYVKVHSEQLVGLFSCIFVKASLKNSLRDVNITTVKRGVGGIYGNKGAIFSRMVVDDTSVCFINVHLAAGQSHKGARNADIAAIMEDKAIFPPADTLPYVRGGDGTGVLDHEMVVFSGDLNYRIDQRRDLVESMIEVNDLAYLLERDQLRREMRANHAFRLRSFAEAPITFPPTYKYDPGTDNYDSSEKRRVPAWCDRILFTRTPRLKAINYQRYEINVSDHRPISAGLAVQVKHIDPVRMREVTKQVMTEWRVHEADILATMAKAYEALY